MNRAFLGVLVLAVLACSRSEPEPRKDPVSAPLPSDTSAAGGSFVLARSGVRIVHADDGDVAKLVRDTRSREASDKHDVVVYVGATWCEPCQRFHKAAANGELDSDFPQLTILEFDLDHDRDRLESAGYRSDLIPLFVMPNADGRASSKRFEGSVKGDTAVANIAPRLRALLAH